MTKQDGIIVDPPTRDINSTERAARRTAAALAQANIEGVSDPLVRQLLPQQDLETTTPNGWTDTDNKWEQLGLGTDQFQEVYAIDTTARAENKVYVIFGVSNLSDNPGTTQIEFRTGNDAVFATVDVEGILTDEEVFGLLRDPVIFGEAGGDGDIRQWSQTADDQVVYHGVVAENRGETYEDLPGRFMSRHQAQAGGGGGGQSQAVRADGGRVVPDLDRPDPVA